MEPKNADKPLSGRVLSVGQYIEDDEGNVYLGGWLFAPTSGTEDITLYDLKNVAKEHKTYSMVFHLVPDVIRSV